MNTHTSTLPTSYALIELGYAGKRELKNLVAALTQAQHVYLFDGTPEEEIRHVGPLLVRLNDAPPSARAALDQWELEHLQGLSYPGACGEIEEFAKHLSNRLTVVLPDGEQRLFRYYDPVSMSLLFEHLDNTQYGAFWKPIVAWRIREENGAWKSYVPNLSSRNEIDPDVLAETPKPGLQLPEGHFRLNPALWNALRLEADLATIRQVIASDPEYGWFKRQPTGRQDEIFGELVEKPLRASGLLGQEDLYTGALLAMTYPLHDIWTHEEVQRAIEEALIGEEGRFREILERCVSPETREQWAED